MPSDQDDIRGWQDAGALNWVDAVNVNAQSEVQDYLPGAPGQTSLPLPAQVIDQDTDDLLIMDENDPLQLIDDDDLLAPDTESDLLHWTRQPLVSKETLGTFARQISPVIIPLPFAVVVFFLTRLLTASRSAFLPPLPTAILLLVLTVLQGSLLYSAGSNDTLWLLYIGGGYALFLLGGVFAAFGIWAAVITLALLLALGALLAQRGIRPTKEGYVDLVEVFGKYTHTLYPGLNLILPWEKVTQRLNTQETTWTTPLQQVPISRDQDVQLAATVSYQLLAEDAHLAALNVRDWESSLQALFVGTLQSVVSELGPTDFLAWTQSIYTRTASDTSSFNPIAATHWDNINNTLARRLQDQVAIWGVQINWVRIQDLTPLPRMSSIRTTHSNSGASPATRPEVVQTTLAVPQVPAKIEKAEPAHVPAPAAAPAAAPAKKVPLPANKAAGVETLIEAYNAVRQGNITDPVTILGVAERFEALASDPVLSQTIDFDATRAAVTLRERAQKFQELAQARQGVSSSLPRQD